MSGRLLVIGAALTPVPTLALADPVGPASTMIDATDAAIRRAAPRLA